MPGTTIELPYGAGAVTATVPGYLRTYTLLPPEAPAVADGAAEAERALGDPVGGTKLRRLVRSTAAGRPAEPPAAGRRSPTVAIAVNDKTRPVPHAELLPPLLRELERCGVKRGDITFIIATGMHPVMAPAEYPAILPREIIDTCTVVCHNAHDDRSLVELVTTSRGTPCTVNAAFAAADLRIVIGNIEPHQFMGFSGGVKGAAIGLAGAATVNANHALMREPGARLGRYEGNPAREDVEELGRLIGVHFAVNAVLTQDKRIVRVFAGAPADVMPAGIPDVLRICTIAVDEPFDAVIASPGGHPKDINIYQSQKGLAHAVSAASASAPVVLAAACPEGAGSIHYEEWVNERNNHDDVLGDFANMPFTVGPHKAFQIARDASGRPLRLVTDMAERAVERLLMTKAGSLQAAVDEVIAPLPEGARVAVIPRANVTIPLVGSASAGDARMGAQRQWRDQGDGW